MYVMKQALRSVSKPSRKAAPTKAAGKKPVAGGRGRDAVAVAIGRALVRKPKVNSALAAMFRANRDLLAP